MMSFIWALMAIASFIYGAAAGTLDAVSSAAMEGAEEAVKVVISLAGAICLWSGVTEVISRTGGIRALSRVFAPVLRRLFKESSSDPEIMDTISTNMAANLLGLGNAATPSGIRAATLICRKNRTVEDLCTLVVINTSSIQLIPTTIAALRGSLGASSPFDVTPAIWCASVFALSVGLLSLASLRWVASKRG